MRTRLTALLGSLAIVAPVALASVTMASATPVAPAPAAFTAPVTQAAPAAMSTSGYTLQDGVTAPVYDYGDAIRESVWVTAPDLDGDGVADQIAVDIIRPAELDGTAQVPIIMDASPYYLCCGRGNESELKEYDEDGVISKFPLYYDNYFVPRGYAFVAVDMAGTGRSTGCTDQGGVSDIESVRATIDWLNGRATAHDAQGDVVTASWSNGRTGMIGKSYDGTLANGVAATGVEGLETIVPVSAISSWYDYNRYQDVPKSYNYPSSLSRSVAQNRTEAVDCSERLAWMDANDGDESGQYTDFWAERDYRDGSHYDASQITASALIMHGLQDTNVKTRNFASWWEVLGEQGVDRKMFLTRLGHVDAFDSDREVWVDLLHRWFDHELMGIDNGILDEPLVSVEVAPNEWEHSDQWPISKARTQQLNLHGDGTLVLGRKGSGTASFINSPSLREAQAVLPGDNPNRLLFTSGTVKHDIRLSGTATVDLDITHTAETGQVGVALVDYGEAQRVLTTGDGALTLGTQSCWGESTPQDDACYRDVERRIGSTDLQVLARGWARLDGAGRHQLTVEMDPNDIQIEAGHQLGVLVVGASRGWVVTLDGTATEYEVNLANSRLNIPMAGPMAGFGKGKGLSPQVTEGTLAVPNSALLPR
ncbi:CocE/NonD family hydrolase [Ornithinimicrobium ciconiae]|uniref:CocE/NonD family hydrolase n=1 Tax=Ornithinimicrobium ciconiae TaxID=2594265 RepID=A0A516GAG3_9MICO|nr:CocE/NonD family hydrolase [Ornithinimicrobium ciconiae]QDO88488.1 CocE/NonD family hydrolase [Ornithinimicrobium ciconiae]